MEFFFSVKLVQCQVPEVARAASWVWILMIPQNFLEVFSALRQR